MTIVLTPEQEQQLSSLALHAGQTPEAAAAGLFAYALEQETESIAMLAQAEREIAAGEVLDHREVWQRLQKQFGA